MSRRLPSSSARTLTMILLLAISLVILQGRVSVAQNVRADFPQIAVGDDYTTLLDLVNKGTQQFSGELGVADDQGRYIAVNINGVSVTNNYSFAVPAGSSIRLILSRQGETVAGHIVVWDRLTKGSPDFNSQIDGSVVFQYKHGGQLLDSVGAVSAWAVEHFHMFAESSTDVVTGIAVSESFGNTVTLNVKAYGENGQFMDGRVLTLSPYGHRAAMINQLVALPNGFRGTVEVTADHAVSACALRLEGTQFSAIDISPFVATYDLSINLNNGRTYKAEAKFSIAGGIVRGQLRFVNPTPDAAYTVSPFTGGGGEGVFLVNAVSSFSNRLAFITLGSTSGVKTTLESISGFVNWGESSSYPVDGLFSGQRRH